MFKESIVCTVIIVLILIGNTITQNYVISSINELSKELSELRENIESDKENIKKDDIKNKFSNIEKKWKDRFKKLAYFIEHDELEKVEKNLVLLNSYIKTNSYEEAIAELNQSYFSLNHLEDKYNFDLENIF